MCASTATAARNAVMWLVNMFLVVRCEQRTRLKSTIDLERKVAVEEGWGCICRGAHCTYSMPVCVVLQMFDHSWPPVCVCVETATCHCRDQLASRELWGNGFPSLSSSSCHGLRGSLEPGLVYLLSVLKLKRWEKQQCVPKDSRGFKSAWLWNQMCVSAARPFCP